MGKVCWSGAGVCRTQAGRLGGLSTMVCGVWTVNGECGFEIVDGFVTRKSLKMEKGGAEEDSRTPQGTVSATKLSFNWIEEVGVTNDYSTGIRVARESTPGY